MLIKNFLELSIKYLRSMGIYYTPYTPCSPFHLFLLPLNLSLPPSLSLSLYHPPYLPPLCLLQLWTSDTQAPEDGGEGENEGGEGGDGDGDK